MKENQRGATLAGYALVLALLVVGSLVAIEVLQANTATVITATADDIGDPRATLDELRRNPNPVGAIDPLNPPPGPTPDPVLPPQSQPLPPGYSFSGNFQGGYPVPGPADLNPGTPYNSDVDTFLFLEGGTAADPAFVIPNAVIPPPYVTICSMYLHYTPTNSGNSVGSITVSVPGDILGYAASDGDLDNTDGWIDGNLPGGANDYRSSREFEPSERSGSNIFVSGNNFVVNSLTEQNNNADEVRIFYAC